MTADIFIGVPVFRGESVVAETLNSIRAQTYRDFRVVMSVDGADDPSIDVCQEYLADGRFEMVVHEERLGWPGNFNFLALACDREFFCYWQQDDYATADYLESLRATIRSGPEIAIAYTDVQWIGDRDDRDTAVDIAGSALGRALQVVEALHYVPLRGLMRASMLPDRCQPIPDLGAIGQQQEFVFLTEVAAAGDFRRTDRGLYYKRASQSSASATWLNAAEGARQDGWCALGNEILSVLHRKMPEAPPGPLLALVLDRLTVARNGRGFFYLPSQTPVGVAQFVRAFCGRYPDRLRHVTKSPPPPPLSGFERPVHPWVTAAMDAQMLAQGRLDADLGAAEPSVTIGTHVGGTGALTLGQGWSAPEDGGTWTNSTIAEINLPPHNFDRVTIHGIPFAPLGPARIGLSCAGGPVTSRRTAEETSIEVEIPSDSDGRRSRSIRVHVPDAVSPQASGVSADPRVLGFSLLDLSLGR